MADISMNLDQISRILFDLVEENAGSPDLADFFTLLHHLGLKGMGIGSGGDVSSSGEIQAIRYVYEQLKKKYQDEESVIFDVGANVGGFLEKALSVFNKSNHKIYSFEPSKETFSRLLLNIASNNYEKVVPNNFGFGKTSEFIDLYSDRDGSALASLYERRIDHFNVLLGQKETVEIKRIDDFCKESDINRIHYLKMDVEGNEFDCLIGAKEMIENGRVDFIQFEFGGANIDSRTFFQDFWYLLEGYKINRIMRGGLHHIKKYTEHEEIFVVQNYLAEIL